MKRPIRLTTNKLHVGDTRVEDKGTYTTVDAGPERTEVAYQLPDGPEYRGSWRNEYVHMVFREDY